MTHNTSLQSRTLRLHATLTFAAVMLGAPAWRASEKVITRAMLDQAEDIIVCNSLRGPLRAVLHSP